LTKRTTARNAKPSRSKTGATGSKGGTQTTAEPRPETIEELRAWVSQDRYIHKYWVGLDPKLDGKAWQIQRARDNDIQRHLEELFLKHLMHVMGLDQHPKGWTLMKLAWKYAHSGGLTDVMGVAEDFAELLDLKKHA
jgi:hypothetical protein